MDWQSAASSIELSRSSVLLISPLVADEELLFGTSFSTLYPCSRHHNYHLPFCMPPVVTTDIRRRMWRSTEMPWLAWLMVRQRKAASDSEFDIAETASCRAVVHANYWPIGRVRETCRSRATCFVVIFDRTNAIRCPACQHRACKGILEGKEVGCKKECRSCYGMWFPNSAESGIVCR